MIELGQFTPTTIPLEQYFNDTPLGQENGFHSDARGKYYLVTDDDPQRP